MPFPVVGGTYLQEDSAFQKGRWCFLAGAAWRYFGGAWAGGFLEGVFHLSETEFLRGREAFGCRGALEIERAASGSPGLGVEEEIFRYGHLWFFPYILSSFIFLLSDSL